jgi:hypothetical protein
VFVFIYVPCVGDGHGAGSEVCASYGTILLPDKALLQYGFFLNTSTTGTLLEHTAEHTQRLGYSKNVVEFCEI